MTTKTLKITSLKNLYVYGININNDFTGNDDYGPGIYTATISAKATMVSFDILIVDDGTLEGNEYFDIVIAPKSLPHGVTRGNPGITRVTIVNDDGK